MKTTVQSIKRVDENIISGIVDNDPSTIKMIYHEQFGKIKSMVINFKNIALEPEDIFQEGLTRAVINVRKGSFKGDSTFSTYLYGICRNLCLKEYNRGKQLQTAVVHDIKEDVEDDNFEAIQLLLKHKDKLDDICISIINSRFGIGNIENDKDSRKFEIIAQKLGISYDNARQRFGRCMSKLKKLVKQDPLFNQLMD